MEWGPKQHYVQNGLAMAILSRAAYEGDVRAAPDQDPDWSSLGLTNFQTVSSSKTGTQSFVAWNDELAVVAFRGTEPDQIEDVLTDITLRLTENNDGPRPVSVHEGFWEAFESVRDKIRSFVQPHANKKIFVTGHSLGAALATLAARDLKLQGISIHSLHTFGSPRVGDNRFASTFPVSRAFRFVNGDDVVPLVPPDAWFFARFQHVGDFNHLTPQGLVVDETKWGEIKDRFANLLTTRGNDFKKLMPSALADHQISGYIEHLEKALP